eukprot:gene18813-biopygen21987
MRAAAAQNGGRRGRHTFERCATWRNAIIVSGERGECSPNIQVQTGRRPGADHAGALCPQLRPIFCPLASGQNIGRSCGHSVRVLSTPGRRP